MCVFSRVRKDGDIVIQTNMKSEQTLVDDLMSADFFGPRDAGFTNHPAATHFASHSAAPLELALKNCVED